ncbi:MAG: glutamate 5-kinase [Pseudomonadota bacterium]|nr:glutamate 5-kinase [Pseudomonadota bacterium]
MAKRWVVKIGSSLLTNNGKGLNHSAIAQWVAQIHQLRLQGVEVALVSSGAVAEGVIRLGWDKRPNDLVQLQAASAVGQMGLVSAWQAALQQHAIQSAQVLLTNQDFRSRQRYLNAKNTLDALLDLGVLPIINENDTVVTDEICFGDNDTLGAMVANLVQADRLVILTDQDGLYSADPRSNPDVQLITEANASDEQLLAMAGDSVSGLGRGGMTTKVLAAQWAEKSGCNTSIVSGIEPEVLTRLFAGEAIGTLLTADITPLAAKKQWLMTHQNTQGAIVLDDGAVLALTHKGKSLLPIGIQGIQGSFQKSDVVACKDAQGKIIALGQVNYPADEVDIIKGLSLKQAASALEDLTERAVIHRNNMVLL